mmetsp:Transcript_48918/g.91682  ORF Transcript_48918/g.91682 Transcript_48918/m.91682 type:complete len:264 (+) Transcript_48918:126-917(+)
MDGPASTVLKIICGDQIFRLLLNKPCEELDYEAIKTATVPTFGLGAQLRFLREDGSPSLLTEVTFPDFVATAIRSPHSVSMLLRMEVVEMQAEPETGGWQEDTRDLEELLAQFEDEPTPETETKQRQSKKRKKKRVAKAARSKEALGAPAASESPAADLINLTVGEVPVEPTVMPAQDAETAEAEEFLVRSKSCPCLPVFAVAEDVAEEHEERQETEESSAEDKGPLWPPTPESSPPQTPRGNIVWVPAAVPVFMLHAPIMAF